MQTAMYTRFSVFMTNPQRLIFINQKLLVEVYINYLTYLLGTPPPPSKKKLLIPLINNYFCSTSLQNELKYERKLIQQVNGKNQVK